MTSALDQHGLVSFMASILVTLPALADKKVSMRDCIRELSLAAGAQHA